MAEEKRVSKLPLEPNFTGLPEQTYLNERLQSARWLGWDLPQATHTQPKTKARSVSVRLAEALGLTSVSANSKPT